MIPSSITHDGQVLERHAAWPDSAHRALTTWRVGDTGAMLPGQWFADPAERDLVAGQTTGSVQVGDDVLIHPDGADRVLVGLADLASRSGSELVVHRPERLALVHRPHPDDPARQAVTVAAPARIRERIRAGELRLTETEGGPLQVLRTLPVQPGQDESDGVVLDWPPGDSLFSMWNDQRWGRAALGRAWASAGLALRRLHDGPSAGLPVHTAESEVELTRQQLSDAHALGVLPRLDTVTLLDHLFDEDPGPLGLLHGRLSDRTLYAEGGDRIIVVPTSRIGEGERARDIAAILVWLEVRNWSAEVEPGRVADAQAALLHALSMDPVTRRRVRSYAVCARLRMAALQAFRPGRARLVQALLASCQVRPTGPPLGPAEQR